jgi:hypothetical protein
MNPEVDLEGSTSSGLHTQSLEEGGKDNSFDTNSIEDTNGAPASLPRSLAQDGGLQAWSAVAGAFCCLFVSFGWINSPSKTAK